MIKVYIRLVLFLLTFGSLQAGNLLPAPMELTVTGGIKNPLGFYDNTPSFSWILPHAQNVHKQYAYELVVATKPGLLPYKADVWRSHKVVSDQSVDVKFRGRALQSRQRVFWKVRYWSESNQPSAWSDVASIEMGLLSNNDWEAQWVKIPDPATWETTRYGTRLFTPQY